MTFAFRSRETALAALFAKISAAYVWKNVPSRRLVLWDQVAKTARPAMYQFEGGNEVYTWTQLPLAKRVIEAKIFIYLDSSNHFTAGSTQMNQIKDAIDLALWPTGSDAVAGKQTLGGVCDHCRIDGNIISDPGDIDDDGLIVIPIKITLP